MVYEKTFRHLLFPFYEAVVKRQAMPRLLREYDQQQWLSAEQILTIQRQKREAIVRASYEGVVGFRGRCQSAGLSLDDVLTDQGFEALPPIDKRDLLLDYEAHCNPAVTEKLIRKSTGGSTGAPFKFQYELSSDTRRNAVMWRGYRWAGCNIGTRTLFIWGAGGRGSSDMSTKESIYHWVFNRKILNSFHMTEENVDTYLEAVEQYKPQVIVGYVAPLVTLARRLQSTGRKLKHRPASIITGAEALHEHQREALSGAFGCPTFNTYGCREVMLIASECEEQSGLHTNSDHLIVETLGSDGTPVSGESGDVVLTDLHNFAMPLIRYRNGDKATKLAEKCACGRGLPLLASVDGRVLDVIRTKSGKMIPGEYFPHMFKDVPGLQEFQVVQRTITDILVRVVCDPGKKSAIESELKSISESILGSDTTITIARVPTIEKTSSGKHRVTLSLLSQDDGANHG